MDDDPNNILLIAGWDNIDNARKFFADPVLKETMGKAGVIEQPDIFYLEEYFQGKT